MNRIEQCLIVAATELGELELGLPPNGGKELDEPRPPTKRSFMDVGWHIPLPFAVSYVSQRRGDGFKHRNVIVARHSGSY
jgi:hypothetical protein